MYFKESIKTITNKKDKAELQYKALAKRKCRKVAQFVQSLRYWWFNISQKIVFN